MIAFFGKQRGLSVGSPCKKGRGLDGAFETVTPEEEEAVYSSVEDPLFKAVPRRQQSSIAVEVLPNGANGYGYVEGAPGYTVAEQKGVTVLCKSVSGDEDEAVDASQIIELYSEINYDCDASALSNLQGPFAFVLYDKKEGRIVAGRNPKGEESFFWGTNLLGEALLFASDRSLLEECADADQFPPGAVFISDAHQITGNLIENREAERSPEMMQHHAQSEQAAERGLPPQVLPGMMCRPSSHKDLDTLTNEQSAAGMARIPSYPEIHAH
jgi:hypothetical protein